MISEDLSMRDHAFSSAPPSVTRLRVSGFAKSLAHTHPYFISVRHTCIYPLFLLAVLFVLHGKRQMTPIIHALTFFPHNTVSLRLVSCSWIERGLNGETPQKVKVFCRVSISCAEALIFSLKTALAFTRLRLQRYGLNLIPANTVKNR